ncbi:MAG: 4-hydroxy-3-methylbut-2-enyl diphosphate reductase [candidate division Zixibacteria bacterium]|nr:4-hydroxy-3-methylbut-2-enyl diphosphate reductase [candidate division Zixibacteria bacterium]
MVQLFFAKELGFCWGVERSIKLAAQAKNENPGKVTILKEIVHNRQVVDFFKKKGVGQEDSLDNIDSGTLVISAHGISPQLKKQARAKGLQIVDTTCPLVERVHKIAKKLIGEGYQIILYGEPEHDEVMGVIGIDPDNIFLLAEYGDINKLPHFRGKLALLTQTTRGIESFAKVSQRMAELYLGIRIEKTICRATEKRQAAVYELAPEMDLMLVIGSASSGNSRRLHDIASNVCARAYLLDAPEQIEWYWFDGIHRVGLTAGASTPSFAVEMIVNAIYEHVGIDLDHSDPRISDYLLFESRKNVQ